MARARGVTVCAASDADSNRKREDLKIFMVFEDVRQRILYGREVGRKSFYAANSPVLKEHAIGRGQYAFSDTQRETAVAIFRGEKRTDSATSQLRNPGITMVLPLSNPW